MNSISEVGNCEEKEHTKNGANRWDSISRYTFLFLRNGALFSNTNNPLLIANGSSSNLEVCDTDFVLFSPSDTVHILPRRKFVPQNRIAAPNWELNNRKKRVYLSIHYFFSGLLCVRSLMSFVNLIRRRRFFVITANHYSVGLLNKQDNKIKQQQSKAKAYTVRTHQRMQRIKTHESNESMEETTE